MATNTRASQQGKDQEVIQGVQKDLSTVASLPLAGTTYTPASFTALVQSRIDAGNQVVTTKAAWLNAVKTYETIDTQATVAVHDLKQYVIGSFGATSSKLADFGFTPRKVVVLTPAQKAAAALKRAATRKARNTMGPKAKLKVTGATAPAPTAAPAGNAAVPAAGNGAPAGAPAAAPATAPTVTVNVTATPAGGQPGNPTATVATTAAAPTATLAPAATAAPARS
jgi:hypothetical protein